MSRHGTSRARRRLVPVVLALAGFGAGCGIGAETAPRVISPRQVPYDLSGPAQVDAPDFSGVADLQPVTVYLVASTATGDKRIVPRERLIPEPVNLSTVLGNLMAGGITGEEREAGLSNQVPGFELVSVARSDAAPGDSIVVTIEVLPAFFDRFPTAEAQRLAIGQIVLTVNSLRPAETYVPALVRFTVGGRVRPVPTGDPQSPVLNLVEPTHYATLIGSGIATATATAASTER